MERRSTTGVLLAGLIVWLLLAAVPASGEEGIRDRKADVDEKIDSLQSKIEAARKREGVLSSEIEAVSVKIRAFEEDVGAASARLDQLESALSLHRRKLERLNELFGLQTRKLVFLQSQHRAATLRLNRRVVEIYTSEPTEALSVVLEAATFSDLMDQLDYLNEIGRQDENIASEVKRAKLQMQETRNATRRTRNAVAEATRVVAARTAEQRAVRDRLAWSQRELATARRDKRSVLASVQEDKEEALEHVEELELQSAALAARIQAAQAAAPVPARAPTGVPSASGFIWPVHGIFTSGYGWRWGRLHAGIDIAVGSGTPVVAAAAGTVIVAGWMGGYGNLVVVDHGNGIATAYGHNSGIAAGVGAYVAQGQVIAYSGNTGNSTGPHVHFEVRVGGFPVDPMGYL